jgi:AAHS family 4-hydroxybenzoate transporter-like MFS transporter
MSSQTGSIGISPVIDRTSLGGFRLRTIVLCALVALLDGFDTQSIAFVAPIIAQEWAVEPSAFGVVFGAGLLGLTLGSLTLGPVADRLGRRAVIIWSTVAFGAFALLTPLASDLKTLALLRFLTGLGLGGAIPNIIALTSEYAPARMRATLVTAMYCGFPLGAVIGGLISAPLIAAHGWAFVFIVGGALPLFLAPVLWAALPESIRFISVRSGNETQVISLLRKIDPAIPPTAQLLIEERQISATSGTPVKHLMSDGRALGTVLLWIVFFSNLLTLYFLINWLPSLLLQLELPMEKAILSIALLNGAGMVGAY